MMFTSWCFALVFAVSHAAIEIIDVSSFSDWTKQTEVTDPVSSGSDKTFSTTSHSSCGGQNCIALKGIPGDQIVEDIYVKTSYNLTGLVDVKINYKVTTYELDNNDEYGFMRYSCDGGSTFLTTTFNAGNDNEKTKKDRVAISETCNTVIIEIGAHLGGKNDYAYINDVNIEHYTGREYVAFATVGSRENALAECNSRGLTLATITTQQENDAVNALCKQTADSVSGTDNVCWIGLHDKNSEDTFEWEDGAPFVYENWNTIGNGQYNRGGYDCVVMGADQKSWIEEASWQVNHCTGVNRVAICSTTSVCQLNSNVIPTINHFPNNTIYLLLHIILAMTTISIIIGCWIRNKHKFIYKKVVFQEDESVDESEKN